MLKGGKLDPEDPINEAAVLSIAASLLCMIYSVGSVSGAHLNPAVTVAILASRRKLISAKDAVCYIAAQVCGIVCLLVRKCMCCVRLVIRHGRMVS